MTFTTAVANWTLGFIEQSGYRKRQLIAFLVLASATTVAYASAYAIRFDFVWNSDYTQTFLWTLPVLVASRYAAQLTFRLTTNRWRFIGVNDVLRLALATAAGTALFFLLKGFVTVGPTVPRSVIAIEALLSALLTAAAWIVYRSFFEFFRKRGPKRNGSTGERVLIIGAGESGYMLAREMLRSMVGYRPIGFVDDDPYKWGTRLAGLEVIGSTDDLKQISESYKANSFIIAVPQATPAQLRTLVEKCAAVGLPYRVLPSIAEVLAGNVRLDQLREVQIEDLLGRNPIELDLEALAEDLRGGCALVTGAAGSIGSELSRQIARHTPSVLLLLDQAETDLFYLELELRDQHPDVTIVPVVRDVVDRRSVEALFRTYRPSHVFHAAAYKHVPMMEANAPEAVRNNVVGSYVIADAAGRYGTEKFVLVSTDKAVRPRSVMGATKRLAEMATIELQERYPETTFAAVRFGNVLGSNGSVIPLFKKQMAAGKPLTVTHPDVTRYFMTIPEAVQLILKASLLQEIRGHVAMLEMGEPLRIVDLAENLLRLSGIRDPERIVFTGLRPGEKLHEELTAPEEETVATVIPKVRLVKHAQVPTPSVLESLDGMQTVAPEDQDRELLRMLASFFPGGPLEQVAIASPVANGKPVKALRPVAVSDSESGSLVAAGELHANGSVPSVRIRAR